jgi:hypothetical protein
VVERSRPLPGLRLHPLKGPWRGVDTTPESWLNQQTQYDLWKAGKKRKALEKKVRSLAA